MAELEIEHVNLIAFAASQESLPVPRVRGSTLISFFEALGDPEAGLYSIGAEDHWADHLRIAATRIVEAQSTRWQQEGLLTRQEVSESILPLVPHFRGFAVYALYIRRAADEPVQTLFTALESTFVRVRRALVMIPNAGSRVLEVADPSAPIRIWAEAPRASPCVILWTALGAGHACAPSSVSAWIRSITATDNGGANLADKLREAHGSAMGRSILHISDLHIGSREVDARLAYLKSHLRRVSRSVDRIVVTGDLMNHPRDRMYQSAMTFLSDVGHDSDKEAIYVPGNHDYRTWGTRIFFLGNTFKQVSKLELNRVTVDSESECVFFCFDSNAKGNFARGLVTEPERLATAAKFERLSSKADKAISQYYRVAVVHHHPYSFETNQTTRYGKLITLLFGGEEKFLGMEKAQEFLSWCAERSVSIILHGHKHVPHHVSDEFALNGRMHYMSAVGCGSTSGAGKSAMCYNIITLDAATRNWSARFFADTRGDGGGFSLQAAVIARFS